MLFKVDVDEEPLTEPLPLAVLFDAALALPPGAVVVLLDCWCWLSEALRAEATPPFVTFAPPELTVVEVAEVETAVEKESVEAESRRSLVVCSATVAAEELSLVLKDA
jgi:hypothetical protein